MPRGAFGAVVMLAALSGCGRYAQLRCAPWEGLDLTDPAGEAPADVFAEVSAAIDQFAAWSARDGLCVEEVRLVEEIDDERDPVGIYYGPRIEVEYAAMDPSSVTFHELCHAADDAAGGLSYAHPDWFGTEEPAEAFAHLCDGGPWSVTALEGLEAACAEDFGSGRQRLLNAEVFGAAEIPEEPPAGTLGVGVERRLVGLPDDVTPRPYAGATAVYLPRHTVDDEGVRWVDLLQFDVVTGTAVDVPGPALASGDEPVVLGSDAGPVLALAGDSRALQVDEAAGVFVEVPFVRFEDLDAGAVIDGVAWVIGTVEGEAAPSLSGIDLVTGAREARTLPEGLVGWTPAPDGALLGGRAWYADRSNWLFYDPAADTWTEPSTPAGWAWSQRVTLPDGRLVATWMDVIAVDPGRVTLSVLDPETGAWWLPDAPCGDDAIDRSHTLLSIGGVPWLWEETRDGPALTRVEVP